MYADDLKSRIVAFDALLTTNGTSHTLFELKFSDYNISFRADPVLLHVIPSGSELLDNNNQRLIWYLRGIGWKQLNIGFIANPGLTNYRFQFILWSNG